MRIYFCNSMFIPGGRLFSSSESGGISPLRRFSSAIGVGSCIHTPVRSGLPSADL